LRLGAGEWLQRWVVQGIAHASKCQGGGSVGGMDLARRGRSSKAAHRGSRDTAAPDQPAIPSAPPAARQEAAGAGAAGVTAAGGAAAAAGAGPAQRQ